MKKRIISVLAMLLVVSMLIPSCANPGNDAETSAPETTGKIEETEKETEKETEAEETEKETEAEETEKETEKEDEETKAETDKPETAAPETQPPQGNSGSTGNSGGSQSVGGSDVSMGEISGNSGSSGGGSTAKPETQPPVIQPNPSAPVAPDGYLYTNSGKLLVHTISDRSVNSNDDTSNTLPFQPLKSATVKSDPAADYNRPKANLAALRPGAKSQGVLLGYDDYMFYQDTLYDFEGNGFLAKSIYDRTVEVLRQRNDWAEAHGKKFYFVIAPNKNSVYPDYMPDNYTLAEYRRYDQFVELLTEAGITAVDLRDSLRQAVADNPQQNLYYKYDTHWNNHAGYYAYRTTMDLIDDDFPNVVIHDKSEYQINYCETYMKDLAYYLGYYDKIKDYGPVYTLKSGKTARLSYYRPQAGWGQFVFAHTWEDGYSDSLKFYQYTNDYNTSAPNIYIMRDSYSIAMIPFLKDSFYKSTHNWTFSFSEEEIINADADIIMCIVAERNLRNYVNNKAVVD
ncbi:MAG: hypothetical protein IJ499_06515 [Clostridia bacterium]|nr:hypothetical protein [Clostridia bacterium]